MAPSTVVMAQLEVEGCTAELYLNGIPVIRVQPPRMPIANAAVEDLIIPGDNQLEVLVEPGAHPSVARSDIRRLPFRPLRATARLMRIPAGEPGLLAHGTLLGETEVSWSTTPPDERDFPSSSLTTVAMGAANGRWGWQDAPVLSASGALVDEACAVLDAVDTALSRNDTAMLLQLIELKMADTLRAYPAYTAATLRAEIEEMMSLVAVTENPVAARDRAAHDFRLVAGGRMLELLDRDYRTSFGVLHHERGTRQPYRITLARVGKALRIVR